MRADCITIQHDLKHLAPYNICRKRFAHSRELAARSLLQKGATHYKAYIWTFEMIWRVTALM